MAARSLTRWAIILLLWLLPVAVSGADPLLCDYCRRMITGPYLVYDGRNLHEACYYQHYARHCGICSTVISGQYIFNSWGDTVCAVHLGEYPTCEYCDRLVAPQLSGPGAHYKDGRDVCGNCESWAVKDPAEVQALLDTVRQALVTNGILIDRELQLSCIDKRQMLDVNSALGKEAWAYTDFKQRASFFGLWKSESIRIYVLSRLPRVILQAVLAHELMHVWLFAHAPLDMDPTLCEGSCEYAAHLVLRGHRDAYADFLRESQETSDDLVYGVGFRSVRDYVKRVGVPAWLDYLRGHSTPPWLRASRTTDR
jgi:hypothetical protein